MKPKKCDLCGQEIKNPSSEEELKKEFEENIEKPYGLSPEADMVSVCTKCYNAYLEWMERVGPEELRRMEAEAKRDGSFKE